MARSAWSQVLEARTGRVFDVPVHARTDITMEVGNFVYSTDPGACLPDSFFGVIRRAKMLTHDVIFLEIEADKPQDFDAGQFMGWRYRASPDIAAIRW